MNGFNFNISLKTIQSHQVITTITLMTKDVFIIYSSKLN